MNRQYPPLSYLRQVIWMWLLGVLAITLIWVLGRLTYLDLFIYYGLWVPFVVRQSIGKFLYKGREEHLARLSDIWVSSQGEYAEGYKDPKREGELRYRRPSFINRAHLLRKRFWLHWDFSIITIFSPEKVKVKVANVEGRKRWTLKVDLRGESFGIYSNQGKKFLTKRYRAAIEEFKEISEYTQKLFSPNQPLGTYPLVQTGGGSFSSSVGVWWVSSNY